MMSNFPVSDIRNDFPILERKVNNNDLVYFDNAATTQKPNTVIDALSDYYKNINSNIHRGVHHLAEKATEEFEETREIAEILLMQIQQVKLFLQEVQLKELILSLHLTVNIS